MKLSLKAARTNKGYTQEEAAKMLEISVSTLGNYEKGRYSPKAKVLARIESVYEVELRDLVFLPTDYN